jgi:conjugal transfer mating pair stabilization protein TraN
MTVYFNPVSFYIAIFIYAVEEVTKCDQDEQVLSLKRGQNLCVSVGSYCSNDGLFGCGEVTESYCCFNSHLARIINEQGRTQIGRTWGEPQLPDCTGFTLAQLQQLDFGAMDLTEFFNEILPSMPNSGSAGATAASYDLQPLIAKVPVYDNSQNPAGSDGGSGGSGSATPSP